MKKIFINYIAEATGGHVFALAENGDHDGVNKVEIDSRCISGECLFFALIGARSDAHTFLSDVRKKGCHNIVVSNREWAEYMEDFGDMNIVLVEDTARALMDLATKYMDDWKELRRVAITGSVGKTSTKEFLYSVMSSKFKTSKTPGNYNSESGVPLTVFSFDEDTEMGVFELGAGYGSEIAELAKIVKPEAAGITVVGTSHLEKFGTRENLLKEKLSIAGEFGPNNTLVINTDCDILSKENVITHGNPKARIITVGSKGNEDYILYDICDYGIDGVQCKLAHEGEECELRLPIVGAHNLGNAALAVALGGVFGIDMKTAARALRSVESNDNRLDVISRDGITVINDTYNASPESMKAGIDVLMNSKGERKIAVLGDMFELGTDSDELHGSVGTYAASKGVDVLITIGPNATNIADYALRANPDMNVVVCEDRNTASEYIRGSKKAGDIILVKASRGMALENLVREITE